MTINFTGFTFCFMISISDSYDVKSTCSSSLGRVAFRGIILATTGGCSNFLHRQHFWTASSTI